MAQALALATTYKSVLRTFFIYLHEIQYPPNRVFSAEELDAVSYDDVLNFLTMRCFDTVDPNYEDPELIVLFRVETVEYWKKAISWFYVHNNLENKTQ